MIYIIYNMVLIHIHVHVDIHHQTTVSKAVYRVRYGELSTSTILDAFSANPGSCFAAYSVQIGKDVGASNKARPEYVNLRTAVC